MITIGLTTLIAVVSGAEQSPDAVRQQEFREQALPLLKRYCFDCHGQETQEGGLVLDVFESPREILEAKDTWLQVIQKLRVQGMPPDDADQPTDEERKFLVEWIDRVLNDIDCVREANPGRVTIRRLSRFEYRNTIRDLVGVDYRPAADFPADNVGYGFDNIGDVLSLSPILMEKYLTAAEIISQQAAVTLGSDSRLVARIPCAEMNGDNGGTYEDEARILVSNGEMSITVNLPADGRYQISSVAFGQQAGDELVKMAVRFDDHEVSQFQIGATENQPQASTNSLSHFSSDGIEVQSAVGNTVGGATAGAGNVISGNGGDGVDLHTSASSNVVQGNRIGTDAAGIVSIPNGANGVNVNTGSNGTTVGGVLPGEANIIANNAIDGVLVQTDAGTGNTIRGNSIVDNVGLGIEVDGNGVTPNDAGDIDVGGNNIQNYPVITSVTINGNNLEISGSISSTANTQFTLDFYASVSADPTGFGEGATYLGETVATTNASGTSTFVAVVPEPVPAGQAITATATDPDGNTSEFSQAVSAPIGNTAQWDGDSAIGTIGNGVSWSDANNWSAGGAIDTAPSMGPPGDNIVFATAPTVATVDLLTDRNVNSLAFQDSYVLANHTLTIATGEIDVDTNVTATISSNVASPADIIKTGDGTLYVTGLVPNIVISSGTFKLGSTGSVNDITIEMSVTAILNGPVLGNITNHGLLIPMGDLVGGGSIHAEDIDIIDFNTLDLNGAPTGYARTSQSQAIPLGRTASLKAQDVHALVLSETAPHGTHADANDHFLRSRSPRESSEFSKEIDIVDEVFAQNQ